MSNKSNTTDDIPQIPAVVIMQNGQHEYMIRRYTDKGMPTGYGIGWMILNFPRLLASTGQYIGMVATLDDAFDYIKDIDYDYCYYNDSYNDINSWEVFTYETDSYSNLVTMRAEADECSRQRA